jgi:periplasmic divalent cation tolerance protein
LEPIEEIAILYVPCGSEEEARRIAAALIQERFIACANIVISRSLYMWEGMLADEQEHILFCKTAVAAVEAAQARIEQLHSYDVPCIVSWKPQSVNGRYAEWVLSQVDASTVVSTASANLDGSAGVE